MFGMKIGDHDQEAVVPLEIRSATAYVLWFDNSHGLVTSMALANLTEAAVTVSVTSRDQTGAILGTDTVGLPPKGHLAFATGQQFPLATGRQGTLEFGTPGNGQVSVLGLRFSPGAFTTLPVIGK